MEEIFASYIKDSNPDIKIKNPLQINLFKKKKGTNIIKGKWAKDSTKYCTNSTTSLVTTKMMHIKTPLRYQNIPTRMVKITKEKSNDYKVVEKVNKNATKYKLI